MAKVDKIHDFKETFLRIINKFKVLEKIPIDHGTGDLLYASEINTLEIIGKFPGINLTQLAEKKGVTKSAVSQIVAKLVKKQLVTKNQSPNHEKVFFLELTNSGEVAFKNHEKFHEKYDLPMIEKLNGMNDKQFDQVAEIFEMLESTIDNYLKDLK
ncbi:MarR family winged helix-turn-helix transcriptional regulator [Anaerotignum sp.]|uniref:MarR family winged helix-turn-helix transcriptional regulator n=1 Tax=Anaerotignum sp. TaxID=2039241 RepID=UPI0027151F69|nr:MarR family transcriptional regulator [Anaerotignum sp.]